MEKILFGAGCFWGVEEALKKIKGVIETKAGYAGGSYPNPTYDDVCRGDTGHAEVVQVAYDPAIVDLDDLFNCFWEIHDPTTLNRQGPDIGNQYRSCILCFKESDLGEAVKSKEARQKRLEASIVTEIALIKEFYEAEEYHQCYFEKNR
jgi:peptide-methionine (S)-S-oxide reductase